MNIYPSVSVKNSFFNEKFIEKYFKWHFYHSYFLKEGMIKNEYRRTDVSSIFSESFETYGMLEF